MTRDRAQPRDTGLAGVKGWLLTLCLLMAGWEPLSIALVAARELSTIAHGDGRIVIWLTMRILLAGLGMAAAIAIWHRHAFGVRLAVAFFASSAALSTLRLATPIFPTDVPPSERGAVLVLLLTYDAAWLLYLRRSRRVRQTLGP